MTPQQEEVLEKHFIGTLIKNGRSLRPRPDAGNRALENVRIAKIKLNAARNSYDEIQFTPAELLKYDGCGLLEKFEAIIGQAGLKVIGDHSRGGNAEHRLHRGFRLSGCSPATLERIVISVLDLVKQCDQQA